MTEKMSVDILVEDWEGYGGLETALRDAIEKMKDGRMIRKLTDLMGDIEDAHADFKKRHQVVRDIKADVDELRSKVDRL